MDGGAGLGRRFGCRSSARRGSFEQEIGLCLRCVSVHRPAEGSGEGIAPRLRQGVVDPSWARRGGVVSTFPRLIRIVKLARDIAIYSNKDDRLYNLEQDKIQRKGAKMQGNAITFDPSQGSSASRCHPAYQSTHSLRHCAFALKRARIGRPTSSSRINQTLMTPRNFSGLLRYPGNTPPRLWFPRWAYTSSPSTSLKSVVRARSRAW